MDVILRIFILCVLDVDLRRREHGKLITVINLLLSAHLSLNLQHFNRFVGDISVVGLLPQL